MIPRNRLHKETSPYLLQHKNNPVDWYPWGEEALQKAREQNKPILLSIGYSACHWCHVMEHESFENTQIAQLMNENFINIKVDREERPDLDHIYQNVAQALTHGGGWPLTVFLTPDLKPFYGGTYFPPEDRYGRPGLSRVLMALAQAYRDDRQSVEDNALHLTEWIQTAEMMPQSSTADADRHPHFTLSLLQKSCETLLQQFDWQHGGFGRAPKFPNPMNLTFLWRFGTLTGHEQAQAAALLSLDKISKGGIYDHLAGGFHRYSVDEAWSVPHFEKMLYDNALLLKLFAEVLLSGHFSDPFKKTALDPTPYLNVLIDTVNYIFCEMMAPNGAFYTAQDADSEGEEGKFFVWTPQELAHLLTPEETKIFSAYYGVTEQGNFEGHATVLAVKQTSQQMAKDHPLSEAALLELLKSARKKLALARQQRIAPSRDDKILTSWNALMISGLAWASQAFQIYEQHDLGARTLAAAQKAFDFLQTQLSRPNDRLFSNYQQGQPKGNAYLDDYAFLAMAALDLSRFSTLSPVPTYLQACRGWIHVIQKHFQDTLGYFFTSDDHEYLIQRPKTLTDQAIPSGIAVAWTCATVLSELTESAPIARSTLDQQIAPLLSMLGKNPHGYGELLCLGLLQVCGPIIVSGHGSEKLCRHPHVFQKPSLNSHTETLIVCHQQHCRTTNLTVDLALIEINLLLNGT